MATEEVNSRWQEFMAPCFEDVPGRPDESMARNANVTKAVHVQAAIGSRDPVKETEWLQEAADRTVSHMGSSLMQTSGTRPSRRCWCSPRTPRRSTTYDAPQGCLNRTSRQQSAESRDVVPVVAQLMASHRAIESPETAMMRSAQLVGIFLFPIRIEARPKAVHQPGAKRWRESRLTIH